MEKITEKAIENQILQWLVINKIYAFKTYDQAAYRDGAYRKNPWQKRGVSDIIILIQGRTIFIEVKTQLGTQSKFQRKFERDVTRLGHEYYVVRCLQDVKKIFCVDDSLTQHLKVAG